MKEPAASPAPRPSGETDDHVTLRGRRDFAIYYLPASVPFWAALFLGLDITVLTWLIWLEMAPRGLLLCLELPRDKDYQDKPLLSTLPVIAIVLLGCAGAMAFVAMFFPEMRETFALFWPQLRDEGLGAALSGLIGTWQSMGVLLPLAVAAVARAWRAWWIDVRQDPAMAHVRFDTRERRTRRMFAFAALILWIALLSRLSALEPIAPTFFASVAAFVYCFLPLVIAEGDKLRRKALLLKEPPEPPSQPPRAA
jgi:hypothetical protein